MSSHPCDQPVSAPQARMIEGMRVHGFGERLRGFLLHSDGPDRQPVVACVDYGMIALGKTVPTRSRK
jgi:hypothetical protein